MVLEKVFADKWDKLCTWHQHGRWEGRKRQQICKSSPSSSSRMTYTMSENCIKVNQHHGCRDEGRFVRGILRVSTLWLIKVRELWYCFRRQSGAPHQRSAHRRIHAISGAAGSAQSRFTSSSTCVSCPVFVRELGGQHSVLRYALLSSLVAEPEAPRSLPMWRPEP